MKHNLGVIHLTLGSALNTESNDILCIYLSVSYEAAIHIIISRDILPEKISRDIFSLYSLVCTKDKLSGPHILTTMSG